MRTCCRGMLIFMLFISILPLAEAAPRKKPSIRYVEQGGVKYLYLRDIAAFYGMRYNPGADGAVLSSKYSTITFTCPSREFTLNGVKVYAGFPVRKSGDEYLLASLDLSKILDPILRIGTLPRRGSRHVVLIRARRQGRRRHLWRASRRTSICRWPCAGQKLQQRG